MTEHEYVYDAVIARIVDGDTLIVSVSLGFNTWRHNQAIRLAGCNARELHEPGGQEARAHLVSFLPVGTEVLIASVKTDKYGQRYDATVTLPDGVDLVGALLAEGWVTPWDGRGNKPVPPWPRPEEDT